MFHIRDLFHKLIITALNLFPAVFCSTVLVIHILKTGTPHSDRSLEGRLKIRKYIYLSSTMSGIRPLKMKPMIFKEL